VSDCESKFAVLGSTGNVYDVVIDSTPRCTCPDNVNGYLCKHILLIYLKVLKLEPSSPYFCRRSLKRRELKDIFSHAPQDPLDEVIASRVVKEKYNVLSAAGGDKVKQKPIEGLCPICYEDLTNNEQLVYCLKTCGQNVHLGCFEQWKQVCKRNYTDITCIYCRQKWHSESSKRKRSYVNIRESSPSDRKYQKCQ